MKHMIVLPAESAIDSGWASRLEAHYGVYFDSIYTQSYSHWALGDEAEIDLMAEEEKLRQHIATLPPETTIIVFAKYAGAILTILAGQAAILKAKHCFFFGPTFDWANRNIFAGSFSVIEGFALPSTVFHSQYDLVSSYIISKKTVTEHLPKTAFVTTPGYEFMYDDFAAYSPNIMSTLDIHGISTKV